MITKTTQATYQTEITFCDTKITSGTYWGIEEAMTAGTNGMKMQKMADGWRIRNLNTGLRGMEN